MFKKIIKIVWLIISILVILILSTVFLEIMKMKLKPIPKYLMGDWCRGDVYVRDYNKLGYFRLKLPPHLKDPYDEDFYNNIGEKSNILKNIPIHHIYTKNNKLSFIDTPQSCEGNYYLGAECIHFFLLYEGIFISKKPLKPKEYTQNYHYNDLYFRMSPYAGNILSFSKTELTINEFYKKYGSNAKMAGDIRYSVYNGGKDEFKFSKDFYEAFLTLNPIFITNEEAKKLPRNMTLSECVKNTLKSTINY